MSKKNQEKLSGRKKDDLRSKSQNNFLEFKTELQSALLHAKQIAHSLKEYLVE